MRIELSYCDNAQKNSCGVFVENENMMSWVEAASALEGRSVRFFPIPGLKANSVVGALLIASDVNENIHPQYTEVYNAGAQVYVPIHSKISPTMNDQVLQQRFGSNPHFFHPVYGLIELKELTNWSEYLHVNKKNIDVQKPQEAPNFPSRLRNYYIREVPPEEVLKNLIEKSVPNRSSMDEKPLTGLEKLKLRAYRTILGKKSGKKGDGDEKQASVGEGSEANVEKKSWWKRRKQEMRKELDNLEERNKKELDRLMNMLKNDPDEALKYALPIDRSGHSRGPEVGFRMQRRSWGTGSFGGGGASGGNVSLEESQTERLRRQYREMAKNYEENENWEKASFVHLELLSDPYSAAGVLRRGKKYEAAAAIYLSKCQQKEQAAECYELGNFLGRAIDLNEELDRQEKVGDLYTKMGNEEKALTAYQKQVDKYIVGGSYFHAGELSKGKMKDSLQARNHYFKGWEENMRPNECLNAYLDTYAKSGKAEQIQELHNEQMLGQKAHQFLDVLDAQQSKNQELQEQIHLIAHETIARNAKKDTSIVNLLKRFRSGELVKKDVLRFKHGHR